MLFTRSRIIFNDTQARLKHMHKCYLRRCYSHAQVTHTFSSMLLFSKAICIAIINGFINIWKQKKCYLLLYSTIKKHENICFLLLFCLVVCRNPVEKGLIIFFQCWLCQRCDDFVSMIQKDHTTSYKKMI